MTRLTIGSDMTGEKEMP